LEVEVIGIDRYRFKADGGIVEVDVHLERIRHGSETAKALVVIFVDRVVIHGSIALYALKEILTDIAEYFEKKKMDDFVVVI